MENYTIYRAHGNALWSRYGTYKTELEARFAIHDYVQNHPPLPNTKAERDKLRASFEVWKLVDVEPISDAEIEARERG